MTLSFAPPSATICFHASAGLATPGVGGNGTVKQFAHTLFIQLAIGSVQGRIARNDNCRFILLSLRLQRACQSKTVLRAQEHCSRGCVF